MKNKKHIALHSKSAADLDAELRKVIDKLIE